MEISLTYQTTYNMLKKIADNHKSSICTYIKSHSNNLFIDCIDDYHNLHGTRIPSATSILQISHMATILFNNIETIPIPYISPNNTSIHNPNGADATILKTILWENYMISFAMSYNLLKTHWIQLQDITTVNKSSLLESLINEDVNANTQMLWRCAKGHECPCNLLEVKEIAHSRGGMCLSTEYINLYVPMQWMCNKSHRWFSSFNCIKREIEHLAFGQSVLSISYFS
ncbi:hypothetical protein C1646_767015 [Rhizophagus diaphanus]|nr:hypothetical protein C1646_767015 [Rhizophagus diaphanus] [Rhizophagus sp. MUCL 43196]